MVYIYPALKSWKKPAGIAGNDFGVPPVLPKVSQISPFGQKARKCVCPKWIDTLTFSNLWKSPAFACINTERGLQFTGFKIFPLNFIIKKNHIK